ncbi:family 43 glycosylhydrolase [Cohnella lubricantis]|uniref:Family 43 glycosylhydrolase n=1 Tax=Cohnella lubricantis TaxID=2163172 RepID=A0A841TBB4_9BACL|nr:family 43 glycosylhydrolase [Cohnella lubricantis]MBB6676540.1 family 43 glycosylhydrolase [Cohnella lubricantis]MBP2120534.1 beta-xylosidase [Cohnella lubricantis]
MYSDNDPVYQNPMTLPEEWEDYGIGDPYILRYDGMYYLYCSTKDNRPGVKGWSSQDLVHWTYEGLVTEDPITTSAYAPEVVYWNGYFYMYTSPAGNGHYVLRSDKPTGPFEVKTGNFGLSIDGSVFIDDDGQWYFTHAGTEGIVIHPMTDPYTMGTGARTLGAAFLGGWTEGSTIIKRGGKYYLTYTGNHVFSKGYRVNYAVSDESPLGEYRVPANNPILIHTEDNFFGLGHSSTFLGPDLDSYYIVYHNLAGRSAEGPPVRHMNIDRLVFSGGRMDVLGPTNTPQPAPKQPEFHSRLTDSEAMKDWQSSAGTDGSKLLVSNAKSEASFTSEYNFRLRSAPSDGSAWIKLLFAYQDSDNYGAVRLDPASGKLTVAQVSQGQENELGSVELDVSFDYTKLHTVRVENDGSQLHVFFDNMQKLDLTAPFAAQGSIGYAALNADPEYSYTAFSNDAGGSSDAEAYKTLPGTIEAVHYMKGDGRGYSVDAVNGPAIQAEEDGSRSVTLSGKGDWLSYKIHAAEAGTYGIYLTVNPLEGDTEVEVSGAGAKGSFAVKPLDEEGWQDLKLGTIQLEAGYHTLTVKLKKGTLQFSRIGLYRSETADAPNVLQDVDSDDMSGMFYSAPGGFQGSGTEDDRLFAGNTDWDDYEVSVNVGIPQNIAGEASVLVRTTNESAYPSQVADSFMGYSITLSDGQVQLQKNNYDYMTVTSASIDTVPGQTVPMRIRLDGSRIQVFWNGGEEPVIDYTDPEAFFHGRVGLRSRLSAFTFTEMSVTSK